MVTCTTSFPLTREHCLLDSDPHWQRHLMFIFFIIRWLMFIPFGFFIFSRYDSTQSIIFKKNFKAMAWFFLQRGEFLFLKLQMFTFTWASLLCADLQHVSDSNEGHSYRVLSELWTIKKKILKLAMLSWNTFYLFVVHTQHLFSTSWLTPVLILKFSKSISQRIKT